ncbi:sigma-70 family RNA polymerase sigma factor [Calderihabitans maritimus]|uniref:RNA polymerase sigma factor n=1 Tax=Calderihabitans maritimus TaxID=1246530 RepID=A0A1Z5HUH9_9FIRM|nr:FliA/WhiG family RNA polymerase sigma factor [Calderihabitans maritimus]GAW92940.1 RNA polymerase sigma factor for flagellar operon [Calderihabitans maritimus]
METGAGVKTYKENGKQKKEMREEMIIEYLPLVSHIVDHLRLKTPNFIEREDLISYGIFGLIDAVKRYDSRKGTKFETYARQRIKGAIIDELRQSSWLPRTVTERIKKVSEAYNQLEKERGEVDDREVAEFLGMEVAEVEKTLAQVNYLSLVSLEEIVTGTIANEQSPDPQTVQEEKEMKKLLAEAIERLPERDRLILSLYYYEELTLKEIGKLLKISESRVSQLHARALIRLRNILEQMEALEPKGSG